MHREVFPIDIYSLVHQFLTRKRTNSKSGYESSASNENDEVVNLLMKIVQ